MPCPLGTPRLPPTPPDHKGDRQGQPHRPAEDQREALRKRVLISSTKYSYSAATDVLTYNSPKVSKGKKTVRITGKRGNAMRGDDFLATVHRLHRTFERCQNPGAIGQMSYSLRLLVEIKSI